MTRLNSTQILAAEPSTDDRSNSLEPLKFLTQMQR